VKDRTVEKVPGTKFQGTKSDLATVQAPKISAGDRGVTLKVPLKDPIPDGFFNASKLRNYRGNH
jgi:hypothetical protein